MTRFATERRVFFVEEPIFDSPTAELAIRQDKRVYVATPHLPAGLTPAAIANEQHRLLRELMRTRSIDRPVLWFYTPMAMTFARDLPASTIVFDCMDELSAFRGAPPELLKLEQELLNRADLVFTGGQSLYEAKRRKHPHVHAFPSSVDVAHFAKARSVKADPDDQSSIPHPRLGFFGVIDERMDYELIDAVAEARPEWQIVLLGPFAKVDPASLPRRSNIHYLGMKSYDELPSYLSGWDVALLPFARNEATRFISPTKTPEYLAAGCPVVSTSVRDVVRPYGEEGLVEIADTPADFVRAVERVMAPPGGKADERRARADRFLSNMSWDRTWAAMRDLIQPRPHTTSSTASTRRSDAVRPGL